MLPEAVGADWAPLLRAVTLVNLYLPQDSDFGDSLGLSAAQVFVQRMVHGPCLDTQDIRALAICFPRLHSATLEAKAIIIDSNDAEKLPHYSGSFWPNLELTMIDKQILPHELDCLDFLGIQTLNTAGVFYGRILLEMRLRMPITSLKVHFNYGSILLAFESEAGKHFRYSDIKPPIDLVWSDEDDYFDNS